jgi:hypothetical protein
VRSVTDETLEEERPSEARVLATALDPQENREGRLEDEPQPEVPP